MRQYQLQGIEGLYQQSLAQMGETVAEEPETGEGNQLPTMAAGIELLRGDARSIIPVTMLFLGRTLEIAAGIGLTGNWSDRSWKNALAGSAAVQLFLLGYAEFCGQSRTARLPSSKSAEALLRGEAGSIQRVALHWVGRSAIIGLGMLAAGERKDVAKQALAGGAAIEIMVLLWALRKREEAASANPSSDSSVQ